MSLLVRDCNIQILYMSDLLFIVILPNKEVKHWILCQCLCDGEVL